MSRYNKIRVIKNQNQFGSPTPRYYRGVKYPAIPLSINDTYLYSEEGDRFDILAQQYYGDSSLWWVISSANNFLNQDSYYLPLGIQFRVPANVGLIQASYDRLNTRN
jgi:hypothetical protein